jgi:predicted secreted protein
MKAKMGVLAAAVWSGLGLVPAAAETPAEVIAEIALLMNATGEAEVGPDVISSVAVNVDEPCRLHVEVEVADNEGSPPVTATMTGAFADIDAESLVIERDPHPFLYFSMLEGREGTEIFAVIRSSNPLYERMKERVAGDPGLGTCSPEKCDMRIRQMEGRLPILRPIASNVDAVIIRSFRKLIALCAEG